MSPGFPLWREPISEHRRGQKARGSRGSAASTTPAAAETTRTRHNLGVAISAGILLYRHRPSGLEVLIAHPGGPLWAGREEGAWSIPKGIVESGETPFEVARREFAEETGHDPPADPATYVSLGEVRTPTGKRIMAWAAEGDLDPDQATSNTFEMPWPPGSGRRQSFPEIDRVAWVRPEEARRLLHSAQGAFVDRLEAILAPGAAEHEPDLGEPASEPAPRSSPA